MTINELKDLFEQEFKIIRDIFAVLIVPAPDAAKSNEKYIWHPGVYVWWHPEYGVVKVGRHFTNSRKRALEHIRDNTDNKLRDIGQDTSAKLILINVKDLKDYHWVAAVEIFLEDNTDPKIKSKRKG
ncbi:MAG: hypothetical protein C4575_14150 [Desulforudis sp.]|jgi:hypothetical protein|nr:MAG: hypothetical protein C4575_14150 [Desulforudis sp.]